MLTIRYASFVCTAALLSACSFGTDAKVTQAPSAQNAAILPAIMPATGNSFVELARKALALGDAAAALPMAERALEANPEDRDAKSVMAEALLGSGRADEAEKVFMSLVTTNGSDVGARTGRAMALLAMGQPQAAKTELASVIAAKPPIAVLSNAGLALALAGDPKAAAAALAPFAFAVDSTPQLRQNYALALTLAGDRAAAYKVAEYDLGASRAVAQVNSWYLTADKPLPQQLAALTGLPSQSSGTATPMVAAALPVATAPAAVAAEPAKPAVVEAPAVARAAPMPVMTDAVMAEKSAAPSEPLNLLPETAAPAPAKKVAAVFAPTVKAKIIHTEAKPLAVAATPVSLRPVSSKQPGFTASTAAPAALRGWLVQVAAVSPNVSGQLLSARLRKQFGSYFAKLGPITNSKVVMKKRTLQRVFVGPYRSANQASQICARIKTRGGACLVRPAAAPVAKAAPVTKI
jgi:Flp pilus assembly protein TadD